MTTIFITSHLVCGDAPTKVSGVMVKTTDPHRAVEILDAGHTAVLPHGAFDLAKQVLRLAGCDDAHCDYQVAVARGLMPVSSDVEDMLR